MRFTREELLSIACALRKATIWYSDQNMPDQQKEAQQLSNEFESAWIEAGSREQGNLNKQSRGAKHQ